MASTARFDQNLATLGGRLPGRRWVLGALFGAGIIGYLVSARLSVLLVMGVLAVVVALASVTWRRPDLGLLALVALVPLNPLFYARATTLGVPFGLANNLSYWKELILAVLLLKLIRIRSTGWVDYLSLAYLGLVALFILLPYAKVLVLNPIAQMTAAREDAEFVAIFLIARHVPMPDSITPRIEAIILALGAFFAGLGIFSHFFPVDYYMFSARTFGMIDTYFTTVFGGHTLVRAGEIFGNPVNLAFYLLIPIGIAIAGAFSDRAQRWYVVGGALCAAGVLFTVTRSAIFAMPLMVALAMVVSRRKVRVAILLAAGALILFPLFSTAGVGAGISAGIDLSNAETGNHITAVQTGLARVIANPLGSGLATAGHAFQRFGVYGGTITENWYLQIGVELGIIGMLLFIALVLVTLSALWRRARDGQPHATAALCALAGIAACGIVLHSFEDLGVAITVWALAGLALRVDATPYIVPLAPPHPMVQNF